MTGEDLAEINLLAIEADAAACGHGDSLVVERVIEIWQPLKPRLKDVAFRRALHAKCLVWPLIVVAIDGVIELGLLLQEVVTGRLGSLELEG